jgi:P-type conjugative transfer protein TrbL
MNAEVLDLLASIFLAAIDGGAAILQGFSLPLLGILGSIMFYLVMSQVLMGGAGAGDALAVFVWKCVLIGGFYWLILNLPFILDAALQTFVQWGLAPAGATFSLGDFLVPSRIVRAGWTASQPVRQFIRLMGWGKAAPWNWPTLIIFVFSLLVVMFAFFLLAKETVVALIEFHFAMMLAPILIPWGILTQTGFFAEMSVAWLAGGLIRMLIMASLMGISINVFEFANLTPEVDPGISEALIMDFVALTFAGLAYTIPKRASSVGGRGMALALGASDVYAPIWRGAMPATAAAISGTAQMGRAAAAQITAARQAWRHRRAA